MSEPIYPNNSLEPLKKQPFSREAEQSVLGGLMLNNDAWLSISEMMGETDFHQPEHQTLFRAIKSLSEEGNPCDPVTLAEWLQKHNKFNEVGGSKYLGLLAGNTPSAANIIAYAKIVRDRSILRQLMSVGTKISESAINTQGRSTAELLDNAEKMVFEISEIGARGQKGFVPIKEILSHTLERIEILSQKDGEITGIPTGFTDFDHQTSGLQKSDLIIVAGRPAMGKTSFAMNIAQYVAVEKQLPVAVFSMEMSDEQLAMRLISSLSKINLQSVRTGNIKDDDWDQITIAVSMLESAPLFIDQTPALSPPELRTRVRRLTREQGQLGLVVIDYLQLMQVTGNKENRVNEVSEISRSLKSLAKEMNVPIVALSQLNRGLEQRTDKRPKMSDLRESGSLEQDADIIVFIYRDVVYNEDTAEKNKAEIIVAKQRNGPIGTVNLFFRGETTTFENSSAFNEPFYGE
jgi:replicative DNA helicase